MNQDIYQRIAQHLDNLSAGYPQKYRHDPYPTGPRPRQVENQRYSDAGGALESR